MKRLSILFILITLNFSTAFAEKLPAGIIKTPPFEAPVLKISDIDGIPFNPSEYQGKWFFVHFWASWCVPCRREVPAIQKMWQVMQEEGLALAFINTSEDEDTVFSFLSIHAPELRALMDNDGQVTEMWQPRGLPATYLVDPKGIVRYQALGGREWHTPNYINFLRSLLKP
ncbi:MAG: TlpA disulfide reductase family protein [Gammaproteobacteria bacterium]|nr:TlpA disulfide reductase family protein [Gammaproteobacteria bacterium]